MGRLELPRITPYASEAYAYTNSATCPYITLPYRYTVIYRLLLWHCSCLGNTPSTLQLANDKNRLRHFYRPIVRVGRIELPTQPWQGRVLPLNHTRNFVFKLYTIFNTYTIYYIGMIKYDISY